MNMSHPMAYTPAPGRAIEIVRVQQCGGQTWAASPERRTVYVLDSLPPDEAAHAIMRGMMALIATRPTLRLVHSVPADH